MVAAAVAAVIMVEVVVVVVVLKAGPHWRGGDTGPDGSGGRTNGGGKTS